MRFAGTLSTALGIVILFLLGGCKKKEQGRYHRVTIRETWAPPREGPHKYGVFVEGADKPLVADITSWVVSPDRRWLMTEPYGGGEATLVDCQKGIVRETSKLPRVHEWSPDSRRYLALTDFDREDPTPHQHCFLKMVTVEENAIHVESLTTEKDRPVLWNFASGFWSPDASAIAFVRCRSCAPTLSATKIGFEHNDLYRLSLKEPRTLTLIQEEVGDVHLKGFAWDGDRPRFVEVDPGEIYRRQH